MKGFFCQNCPLAFEIGGYVYWDLTGDTDRVVCLACGTMHKLDFHRPPDASEFNTGTTSFYARPEPLCSAPTPWELDELEVEELLGPMLELDGPEFVSEDDDDWIHVETFKNRAPLESLACNYCRAQGKLISLESPTSDEGYWPMFRDKDWNYHCPVCQGPLELIYDVTIN